MNDKKWIVLNKTIQTKDDTIMVYAPVPMEDDIDLIKDSN